MAKVEGDHIVESTQEARAGATGQNVRYVLAFGTVGVPCCSCSSTFTTSCERAVRVKAR